MLKIKLARFGKKKQPHYRIVVNEARDKRDGKSVDTIGHYAPTLTPKLLQVDMTKFADWIKKGAQPTDTVRALVTRFQSGNPFPAKKNVLSKKARAKQAAAAEAAAKPAEETKVEEPNTEVAAEASTETLPVEPAA